MEHTLSPALRDQHLLLYMHDVVAEYTEYLETRIAKLREMMILNLNFLDDESDTEEEHLEMETFIELQNHLFEVCL